MVKHHGHITDASGSGLASGGAEDGLFGGCVSGCSDSLAENFNADADLVDDSLCEYALVQGCMDEMHVTMIQQLNKTMVHVHMLQKV